MTAIKVAAERPIIADSMASAPSVEARLLDTAAPERAREIAMLPAPRITGVEFVRATPDMSLLRLDAGVDLAGRDDVALVVRGVGMPRRLRPLPSPNGHSDGRFSFAVPAPMRDGRFSFALGEIEIEIDKPPERTREDAIAAIALERAQKRVAELERALAKRAPAPPPSQAAPAAPAPPSAAEEERTRRLEEQLAQHRLVRAQLARELEELRSREHQIDNELAVARAERERLEEELRKEREAGRAEQGRLEETLEAARSRVNYLERRLVETQARAESAPPS
jgi:hypothetical protein